MTTEHKVNNSEVRAEQAARKTIQTLKLGLDVHADSIMVVRILDHSGPQPAQKFTPAKFLGWVKTQLKLADEVHSCYEAGPFGYGLHRALVALGVCNLVVQPVCLDERHTGVNHDKSDARELAQRLDRYVAGNAHALATVRVPTPKRKKTRGQPPARTTPTRSQTHRRPRQEPAAEPRLPGKGRLVERRALARPPAPAARLADPTAGSLPPRGLTTLTQELKDATTALEQSAPALRPKGYGGLCCTVIEREVADWQRFRNRRQMGSDTGLCGGVSASGRSTHLLAITKHGNVRLRTALVELAWRMVTWQRDCKLVQHWWPVLGNPRATKAAKKKAVVAVARQLAVDLWRWRTAGRSPKILAGRWSGWKQSTPKPERERNPRRNPDEGRLEQFETARARKRTGAGDGPLWRLGALVSWP